MENFISINGRKIPLPDDVAEQIEDSIEKDNLVSLKNNIGERISHAERTENSVQIGKGAVKEQYRNKSIIVGTNVEIEVIDNKKEGSKQFFPQMIIFKKKKQ